MGWLKKKFHFERLTLDEAYWKYRKKQKRNKVFWIKIAVSIAENANLSCSDDY